MNESSHPNEVDKDYCFYTSHYTKNCYSCTMICLSSDMDLDELSLRSCKNLDRRSFAFLPRSLFGSSSFASIAFKNLGTNLCMKLVTLTDGELWSWLIHSRSTIGASYSVHVSNLLQTELIKASSLNGIL